MRAELDERENPTGPRESSAGVAIRMLGRIGKRLMAALLAHGRSLGCTEAWLGTEPDNVAARRLYAAAGGAEEPMVYVTFGL